MIILDQLTNNLVKFIPRQGVPFEVIIRDEQTKEVTSHLSSFAPWDYYQFFYLDKTLIDNRKYQMTILDSNKNVLYRDNLFVTTQEIEIYSTDKDEYTIIDDTPSTNSKYKII